MTELFEKYYGNSLSSKERSDFELKLKSDETFAQDYDAYVMMMDHMDAKNDISNALASLDEIHNETQPQKETKKNVHTRYWVALGLITLLALAAYFVTRTNTVAKPSPREIFASNFEPAPISFGTKGSDLDQKLQQIDSDYRAKKYDAVIDEIAQLNLDSLNDNRLYLMLASASIARDNFSQARDALKPLENSSQFINEYRWYSALSYLGEENPEAAKSFLIDIPESSNYSAKAKAILSNLEIKK